MFQCCILISLPLRCSISFASDGEFRSVVATAFAECVSKVRCQYETHNNATHVSTCLCIALSIGQTVHSLDRVASEIAAEDRISFESHDTLDRIDSGTIPAHVDCSVEREYEDDDGDNAGGELGASKTKQK